MYAIHNYDKCVQCRNIDMKLCKVFQSFMRSSNGDSTMKDDAFPIHLLYFVLRL